MIDACAINTNNKLKIKTKEQSLDNTKVRLNPEVRPCTPEVPAL